MKPEIIDALYSANLIVRRLLAVQAGEQVALVCDAQSEMAMAYALAGVIESVGAEYTIMMMPSRRMGRKNELTPVIEQGLGAADCLIGLTASCGAPTYSTAVKRLFQKKQLRSISMVMRSMDNFTQGGARADYDALYEEGQQLAALWQSAEQIHVTTPAGTDLHAPIAGEVVIVECGFATEPGQEAAFSDGEVSQMPRENCAEGVIVVDGPVAHIGSPASPIRLLVSSGRVTRVEGESPQANELRTILSSVENAANIAEIGIGLNPMSRRNGDFEEEKKARGNVHIALGDNIFYGGNIQCAVHMDMVLYRPTVLLDGQVVVDSGEVRLQQG